MYIRPVSALSLSRSKNRSCAGIDFLGIDLSASYFLYNADMLMPITYVHEGLEISHRIPPPNNLYRPDFHFEPPQFGNDTLKRLLWPHSVCQRVHQFS